MATRAMDINTDPSSDRTMDPEWSLAACQGQMSPWPRVAVQGSQICMAPTAAWSWLGPSQHLWATGKATEFYSHFSVFNQIEDKLLKMHLHNFLYISLRFFLYFYLYVYLCVWAQVPQHVRVGSFLQLLDSRDWTRVSLGSQVPFPTELPCPPLLLFLVVYNANNKFSQFLFENFLISPF